MCEINMNDQQRKCAECGKDIGHYISMSYLALCKTCDIDNVVPVDIYDGVDESRIDYK